jgi:surface protein
MKRILLLIVLALTAQTIKAQTVVLDTNGVTLKWTGTTVPSPYFIQASPRGTLEWFAIVNNESRGIITNYAKNVPSGITYFTPPGESTPIPFNNIVTTLVTDMTNIFNQANAFNQPLGSWDVSSVVSMDGMFAGASAFNQPIGSWDVSNVIDMSYMFVSAWAFNQPLETWDVSKVTNMGDMFAKADAFNQPIGSWDVSNVTDMRGMFALATAFNQPIGSWNVSQVTDMSYMFINAWAFNQPIGDWDVSNVTSMWAMFRSDNNFIQHRATAFNQPIGSWNVSKVTNMGDMFAKTAAFNQPIGSWNVSNVTDMRGMFALATAFNQPIGSWDVSNVINMNAMFALATAFNQPIGSWDVSQVEEMDSMFAYSGLSTANYDATLIGWSTITSTETALKPNVFFDASTSKYCNGALARSILTSAPNNWTITDSGLDCTGLNTEEFDTSSLKLYPNPVLSVLNIDNNLTNQPYKIIDNLGKVILKGNLNEGDNSINVEQLSKGIYYLKVSDKNARKFIKE